MRCLNIGCGPEPVAGWDNLDLIEAPGIQFSQDASSLGNIATNTYDLIEAKDVIEHLPFRRVRPALSEWLRVLKPGGRMEIETPNAVELAMIILRGSEAFPQPSLRQHETDATDFDYFNRVAYGHQDHPGNFHACYFRPEWLIELLQEAGATTIELLEVDEFRFRLAAVK